MPRTEKLSAEEMGAILGQQPMSAMLMTRVCGLLSRQTRTKTICLDGPLPRKMRFGRRPQIFVQLAVDHNRWVCSYNDGQQTITQYNADERTDASELSTHMLRAYNMQPFELKQTVVRSDVPLSSSDADSGFACAAIAALLGQKNTLPNTFDYNEVRQNLLRMVYRGKMNGFPDYHQPSGCGGGGVKPDEVLLVSLFAVYQLLNPPQVTHPRFSTVETPRRSTVVPFFAPQPQIQELDSSCQMVQRLDDRQLEGPLTARADCDRDMEHALGMPDAPVDGRRVIRYEKGPNSAALSIATAGVMEDNNIRFIQYERVTKEIHYMKPKSDKA